MIFKTTQITALDIAPDVYKRQSQHCNERNDQRHRDSSCRYGYPMYILIHVFSSFKRNQPLTEFRSEVNPNYLVAAALGSRLVRSDFFKIDPLLFIEPLINQLVVSSVFLNMLQTVVDLFYQFCVTLLYSCLLYTSRCV